ncbi:hypothetical protein L7F22_051372 [Adiantum nelumboides]|nr:hypothetical protein [Adiantum nelumboides]
MGFFYGMQWLCLIHSLADHEGGPPLLVIIGIDSSKPHPTLLGWLEENGCWLVAHAKTYNVPFHFHAIYFTNWEEIDPASLHLHKSEVPVINCMNHLRHLADESVDSTPTMSPHQKLLISMCNLSPNLLLIAEMNSSGSLPFFCLPLLQDSLHVLQSNGHV